MLVDVAMIFLDSGRILNETAESAKAAESYMKLRVEPGASRTRSWNHITGP